MHVISTHTFRFRWQGEHGETVKEIHLAPSKTPQLVSDDVADHPFFQAAVKDGMITIIQQGKRPAHIAGPVPLEAPQSDGAQPKTVAAPIEETAQKRRGRPPKTKPSEDAEMDAEYDSRIDKSQR